MRQSLATNGGSEFSVVSNPTAAEVEVVVDDVGCSCCAWADSDCNDEGVCVGCGCAVV